MSLPNGHRDLLENQKEDNKMKSLWINLIIVAALIVACNHPSIAQTPEQLYQRGLMKEEGEGALQDAISLFCIDGD